MQHRAQQPGQGHLPGDLVDQLDLGGGQVDVGRQQVQSGDVGLDQDVFDRDVVLHQQVVDGQVEVVRVDPEPDRQRALRVEVDQQHLAAVLGERRAQVDGGGGLADAALLVGHRDDPRRAVPVERHRLGDRPARRVGGRVRRTQLRAKSRVDCCARSCEVHASACSPLTAIALHALPATTSTPAPWSAPSTTPGEAGRPSPDCTTPNGPATARLDGVSHHHPHIRALHSCSSRSERPGRATARDSHYRGERLANPLVDPHERLRLGEVSDGRSENINVLLGVGCGQLGSNTLFSPGHEGVSRKGDIDAAFPQ